MKLGGQISLLDMIRERTWVIWKKTLAFQKVYAEVVCRTLEAKFNDNDIISVFSILNPSNMPSKRVGLNS